MYKGLKIIAIIPARRGSKGLPGKNTKHFAGKPLIGWTLQQARGSCYIDDIVVSTDDTKIASISKKHGGRVPFLRPASLAKDHIYTIDVVIHLLKKLARTEKKVFDFAVVLQPTSPLRNSADIDKAIEMLAMNKSANAVVGITEVSDSPYITKTLTNKGFINSFIKGKSFLRRQDEPAIYKLNGAVYACKIAVLLKTKMLIPKKTIGYVMPKERSIDIDDILDFKLAELFAKNKKRNQE